jgi:hypothetical protein
VMVAIREQQRLRPYSPSGCRVLLFG